MESLQELSLWLQPEDSRQLQASNFQRALSGAAAVREGLEGEIAALKTKASDLSTRLKDATDEGESLTKKLMNSERAVTRLTSTLEGVSDERDKLEHDVATAKVCSCPWNPSLHVCTT